MNTNWYILYAKPGKEKKVSTLLEKKKIKHFLPTGLLERNSFFGIKIVEEPLFPGYIFVFTTTVQLSNIQRFISDLKVVYWKSEPAIIPENEIRTIKGFISAYQEINVKKIKVTRDDESRVPAEFPPLIVDERPLAMNEGRFQTVLPSLGYTLNAKKAKYRVIFTNKKGIVDERHLSKS